MFHTFTSLVATPLEMEPPHCVYNLQETLPIENVYLNFIFSLVTNCKQTNQQDPKDTLGYIDEKPLPID